MRLAVGVVLVSGLVAGILFLPAAKEPPYYQQPPVPTLVLWDSRVDAQGSVPRPDNPAVDEFLKRFPDKLVLVDLAQGSQMALSGYDIVMVHPSALANMDTTLVQRLKAHLSQGVVVWTSAEIEPFLSRLGINYFGYEPTGATNATVVGLGVKDEGGLLPRYMLISVSSASLASDGPRVALNGLISGATELLTTRANPD